MVINIKTNIAHVNHAEKCDLLIGRRPEKRNIKTGGKMKKVSWLIPLPDIKGSGGQKTLIDKINYLAEYYPTNVYVARKTRRIEIANKYQALSIICDNFGELHPNINLEVGYDNINDGSDLQIATLFDTADYVAKSNIKKKAYFVQDLEYTFMPMNYNWLKAEKSYRLGLKCITIGKWLEKTITQRYNADARSIHFGVDLDTYRRDYNCAKEKAICILFQPDKARRLEGLIVEALKTLSDIMPEVTIYLYGSNQNSNILPDLPNVRNLKLISVPDCFKLYNKCQLGVCFSPTNPSRIPFEMMACGLPCLDINYQGNKEHDYYPEYTELCCEPEEVVKKIFVAMRTEMLDRHRVLGLEFVKNKTYQAEHEQFKAHIDSILAGKWA
jgi:hypothetical protein